MLHITNGDNACERLKQAGVEGAYLSWADVLHDGPVPDGLVLSELSLIRARFISYCGWATEFEAQNHFQTRDALFEAAAKQGEVVIWNSHELYDQLHLLQLLNWYAEEGKEQPEPKVVFVDALIADADVTDELLKTWLASAMPVTTAQVKLAAEVWQAFTSNNPRALASYAQNTLDDFPFLAKALQRMLAEYPSPYGISQTECQILKALESGLDQPGAVFAASQEAEEIRFMGDSTFWLFLKAMVESKAPLVELVGGGSFKVPGLFGPDDSFLAQRLSITELGQRVLSGEANWLDKHIIDRWIGGVHLNPDNRWFWDGQQFLRS